MSYVFDIYRGVQKPVKSLIDYGVFVSFFPLLVAGPIERANHLLPQVQKRREFNYSTAVEGGRLILWGLFKKVIIADSLAGVVDEIFLNYQHAGSAELVVGALFFAFQIYGDFSGYSDIALGTAKLFGIELLSNFRFPYFSRDIAEFWRRWHISLSSWFRDYLYIPLGGSRVGKVKAVRNTFIIFLVSGFWHGANWTFIVWGFIHACGFMPLLLTNRNRKYVSDVVAQGRSLPTGREFLQMLSTFVFVTFAWIFFRADSIGQAAEYVWGILSRVNQFNAGSFGWSTATGFALIAILLLLDWNFRYNERQLKSIPNLYLRRLVYASLIVALVVAILISNSQSFIYFQF
jgi:D-alanyl-lipoteichoic acid acyltransferase DltB (MBOAT superfamily)